MGVSACAGNTDAATAFQCADALLKELGADSTRLVPAADAPTALAALSTPTVVLALGPLTHCAAALRHDPSVA